MKLSSRIQNMSDSPIKLSPYAALAKRKGKGLWVKYRPTRY